MNLAAALTELSELTKQLERDLLDADHRDGMNVPDRIRESFQGWPSGGGYDRTSRRATDRDGEPLPMHSDPTGDAGIRPDRARDDLRQIERHIKAAQRAIEMAGAIGNTWQLRAANVIERGTTAVEPGCTSCARTQGPRGGVYWSPVYRHTKLADGTAVAACQACYSGPDGIRETGHLPPKEAVEARRDGKRWRGKAVA